MKTPPFIVFDRRESLLVSAAKDLVTFGVIFLCVYVSHGSRWWTFFTGCFALLVLAAAVSHATDRRKTFRSKAELQAWVDSIEEPVEGFEPREP